MRILGILGVGLASWACRTVPASVSPPRSSSGGSEAALEALYEEALRLEEGLRFQEALARYDGILRIAPDFRDARERANRLSDRLGAQLEEPVASPAGVASLPAAAETAANLAPPLDPRPPAVGPAPHETAAALSASQVLPQVKAASSDLPEPHSTDATGPAASLEAVYERALRLEVEHRYPQAVEVYDALLSQRIEGYREAALRRKTLVLLIELAEALYAQALASDDDTLQIELLEQIEVFWPDYRDVRERLRVLRNE